jgi:hypothetical protein
LKKAERRFSRRNRYRTFIVEADNVNGLVGQVSSYLEGQKVEIKNIQLYKSKDNDQMIKLLVKLPGSTIDLQTLSDLQSLDGVKKVYEE